MNSLVILTVFGMLAAAHAGFLHAGTPLTYAAAAHPVGIGAYHHVAPVHTYATAYHHPATVHAVGYAGHPTLVRVARSPAPEPKPDPQLIVAGPHYRSHHAPLVYGHSPAYAHYGRSYGYSPVVRGVPVVYG